MSFKALTNQYGTNAQDSRKTVVLPLPGRPEMVQTDGGGFGFQIDGWKKLQRFLILGTDKGTFYASEKSLNMECSKDIIALITSRDTEGRDNGLAVLHHVVNVSAAGRAKNNDYALYVLALLMTHGSTEVKRAASDSLPLVARTGTHLMHFVGFANSMRGWGTVLKRAVQNWYGEKDTDKLAYNLIKYQSRDGWSQRDVLRLSHPHAQGEGTRNALYRYFAKGKEAVDKDGTKLPAIIEAFEEAKTASESKLVQLITTHRMSHEMIPNERKNSPAVWEALFEHMGTTATIRNLNKMTALGLVAPLSTMTRKVVERITSAGNLAKDKIHPLQLLIALRQYSQGHGDKGSLTWTPVRQINDALEAGFYTSFATITPSGKNMFLGLDVSGSMSSSRCVGAPNLTCAEGTAVMAMVTVRSEKNSYVMGFSSNIVDLKISATDTLASATKKVVMNNFGSTNPGAAIQYAIANKMEIDLFGIYTDNDLNTGRHPTALLKDYRHKMQMPEARMAVIGMAVNGFTIADPKDALQMDMVGFDANTPRMLSDFANGYV